MPWPLSQDYNEVIQSPAHNFADPDLKRGTVATNPLGLPIPCSGNFADVYQVRCPDGSRWAVKCFTREAPGLRERYQEISRHLRQAKLPFTVDFTYLEQGIRVAGSWYPVLKMEWVEGLTLNQFVAQHADRPATLEALLRIWGRMARHLRAAEVAHADLQHGNVLLVPDAGGKSLALKLVDYDGMFVPALAGSPSGEVGHAAYQHPRRLREGTYSLEVDRFPVLLVATAIAALKVQGRALWEKYDDGDNLLFRQQDLEAPTKSMLFYELLKLDDPAARFLAENLIEAARKPLEETPLLEELIPGGGSSSASTRGAPATPPPVRAADPTTASTPAPSEVAADDYPGGRSRGINAPLWIALGGAVALLAVLVGVVALVANHGAGDPTKGQGLARGDGPADSWKGRAPAHGDGAVDSRKRLAPVREDSPADSRKGQPPAPGDGSADPKPPESLPNKFKNSLGIVFVLVPKGKSWLGGGGGKPGDQEVEFEHDFYLGKYEVTQEEWQNVMGTNPSHFSRSGNGKDAVKDILDADLKRFPVESVTWDDARAFIVALNKRVNEPGWVYRLPTEEEWEYACRGGPLADKRDTAFDWYFDKPTNELRPEQANYDLKRTCKVGSYSPNSLGLCDMHGNVWEWCDDTVIDTQNLLHLEKGDSQRVERGGCWHDGPPSPFRRTSARISFPPSHRVNDHGLRVARVPLGKEDE